MTNIKADFCQNLSRPNTNDKKLNKSILFIIEPGKKLYGVALPTQSDEEEEEDENVGFIFLLI